MSELPSGTVTFLFTDIVSSTDLVRKLGPRYADFLGVHRQLLRAAFAEYGGREIDTQGDSFFVAFERVRDAVLAGVAVQRSVAEHRWQSEDVPAVRIGLHTTEPHVWEEGYVGVGVHRAHRVCAVAHGGQVVLSRSTAGLVADEELEGIGLLDLGDHRLKGLDHPERIFQLVIDGLENDFPPLDTIEGTGLVTETVTALFADLAGLTRIGHEIPPIAFRTLVSDYHRTLERIQTESGGRGISAFGDTSIAVYRSARQAVVAAADLQRIVAEHEWPSGVSVALNIGLDSGEAIATAHGYFGEAVNRSAFLSNHAKGGETLLSETTRNLLEGEDIGVLELLEVGQVPLVRGGRPRRIYRLIQPGLTRGGAGLEAAADDDRART
jgi:class 3 adenylate cyclase